MRSLAVLVILLAILTTSGRADGPAPLPVAEIAPGVYVHQGVHEEATRANQGGIANIGFVVGDAAVAVIDSGGSPMEGQALLQAIRRVTALPVRYVINTHFHPDHVFGNVAFVAPGTEFVAHQNMPTGLSMRKGSYLGNFEDVFGKGSGKNLFVRPTHLVSGEEILDLGHRALRLQAFPIAHTDSDLIVQDLATKTLFAGDLVFLERTPAVDGSILGWLKAIEILRAIPADRVVPGHGPVSAPWPGALDDEQHYFDSLVRDVRKLIAAGGSLRDATEQIGASERGHWLLFDSYNARNVTAAYTELEWE